jgi:cell division protein FtsB
MLEFYQKRSLRTVLHSPLALAIAVVICLGLVRIVYDRYSIEQEMIGKRVEAETKLHELETRKADLEKKVQYLSNDRGIEAEMRRNFDVARPGEQVVIIIDKEATSTVDPLPKMPVEAPSAWYEFWR